MATREQTVAAIKNLKAIKASAVQASDEAMQSSQAAKVELNQLIQAKRILAKTEKQLDKARAAVEEARENAFKAADKSNTAERIAEEKQDQMLFEQQKVNDIKESLEIAKSDASHKLQVAKQLKAEYKASVEKASAILKELYADDNSSAGDVFNTFQKMLLKDLQAMKKAAYEARKEAIAAKEFVGEEQQKADQAEKELEQFKLEVEAAKDAAETAKEIADKADDNLEAAISDVEAKEEQVFAAEEKVTIEQHEYDIADSDAVQKAHTAQDYQEAVKDATEALETQLTQEGSEKHDILTGFNTDDSLYGNEGHDTLLGRAGSDTLLGDEGDDMLFGHKGADILRGEKGNDTLRGGQDNDMLYGGEGNDIIYGNKGNDILWGGQGDDRLYGGNGNDILKGGSGHDILEGGKGADIFCFDKGSSLNDIVDFEDGKDLLFFENATFEDLVISGGPYGATISYKDPSGQPAPVFVNLVGVNADDITAADITTEAPVNFDVSNHNAVMPIDPTAGVDMGGGF